MNISHVTDKVIRGEHPLTTDDLKKLGDLGVKTILNLERGWFEFFHGRLNWEVGAGTLRGFNVIHLQLGDIMRPTSRDILAAVKVLTDPYNGTVYVHCMHGVDRTGLAVAAYRVFECKWTPEKALDEMMQMGFHKVPYQLLWLPWFKKFLPTGGLCLTEV